MAEAIAGTAPTAPAPSPVRRSVRIAGWATFFLVTLIFFTVTRLPEDRVKALIQGELTAALGSRGITYTAGETDLSVGIFGISYEMRDVKLGIPGQDQPAAVKRIAVYPSVWSLLRGHVGGGFRLDAAGSGGRIDGDVSLGTSDLDLSFSARDLDLGQIGLLPILAGIRGGGVIKGEGSFSGDPQVPSSLSGKISLDLKKIVVESQLIAGFPIPRLQISDGQVELRVERGKAVVRNLRLGKSGNPSDDVQATVNGDVSLGKQWEASQLNLKAQFKLSESVLKSFSLLEMLLAPAKQADGGFGYQLTGRLDSPFAQPLGAAK